MQLQKDKTILNNYNKAIQNEWLETNGLGGWAGSTVIGCNTRRYHALLVAATVPPDVRMSLINKLDETVIISNQRFELSTNDYGDAISPEGYQYLSSFAKKITPEWLYCINDIELKKTVTMIYGENTTLIIYDVLKAAQSFSLELLPLISIRGYHELIHANDFINRNAVFENDIFKTTAYNATPEIFIKIPAASFHYQPDWYYNFHYSVEQQRGLDFEEDLFTHGKFNIELKQGDSLGIILSTDDPSGKNAHELFKKELQRKELLLQNNNKNKTSEQLFLAADQFIVNRNEDSKTVIAGYHWFSDWGRDTMISLPGLCLSTGRNEDAKKIISFFAKNVSMGMLPNCFTDNNATPEYNTVDATLWYFIAVHKYLQATNDKYFVLNEILPVLKNIIDWHYKGTRYNIHVTDDGLLYAGEKGQQLTWMDARVGDLVVTPRMGKPVEVQALWYNALKIFSQLLSLNNETNDASIMNSNAEKAKQNFNDLFWNAAGNYLYDNIDENKDPDASLRPNQLFAISLPFTLIDDEKAKSVLEIITEKLYTPVGLRSLSLDDTNYIGVYDGNQPHRDAAYHQGTVWAWLLGPYIDALTKIKTEKSKLKSIVDNFIFHLNEACIGSVSEIFDGDEPHHPRGCVAQAWSVAEILRVIKDYELY